MTSMREGEPEHFVSQAVHIGDETVVLTAQRTTCPALVITPASTSLSSAPFVWSTGWSSFIATPG